MYCFHYLYYRAYGFYRDKLHALEPHTYASALPMLIQVSILLTVLYVMNYVKMVDIRIANGWLIGGFMLTVYFVNDYYYKGRYNDFAQKWKHENRTRKEISGYLLLLVSVLFVLNIFFISSLFSKLK